MAFNELTDEQDESLAHVMEECAETIKAAAKIQRFGLHRHNPDSPNAKENIDDLEEEMGNVLAAFDIARLNIGLSRDRINEARSKKLAKVRLYFKHAKVPARFERY